MNKEQIFDIVKNAILEVLPDVNPDFITLEQSLKSIGANSVDRMEVITMSMEELSLKIPLMSFAKVRNIGGVVDVLIANS